MVGLRALSKQIFDEKKPAYVKALFWVVCILTSQNRDDENSIIYSLVYGLLTGFLSAKIPVCTHNSELQEHLLNPD